MNHEILLLNSTRKIFKEIGGNDTFPVCVEIHPTDKCNQHCHYCFHRSLGFGKEKGNIKFLTTSDYVIIFAEMSRIGVQNLSISGGGEPFMAGNLFNILQLALNNNLNVRVVTNGSVGVMSDLRMLEELVKCDEIRFSVDSTKPDVYSALRNVPESHLFRVFENIKKFNRLS